MDCTPKEILDLDCGLHSKNVGVSNTLGGRHMFSRDNEEGTELDYDIHYLFSIHGLLLPFEWLPNPMRKGTVFHKGWQELGKRASCKVRQKGGKACPLSEKFREDRFP